VIISRCDRPLKLRVRVLCGVRTEGKETVDPDNFQAQSASRCFRDNGYSYCKFVMCGEKRTVCVVQNAKGHILDTRIVGVFSLHIFSNVESRNSHRMNAPGILRCADISELV
jgi:hypothetical protein